jgi:hypothetical protein
MAAEVGGEPHTAQTPPAKSGAASVPFFAGQASPLQESTPQQLPTALGEEFAELYAENVAAKLWKVAEEQLREQQVLSPAHSYHHTNISRTTSSASQNTCPQMVPRPGGTARARPDFGPAASFPAHYMRCWSDACGIHAHFQCQPASRTRPLASSCLGSVVHGPSRCIQQRSAPIRTI